MLVHAVVTVARQIEGEYIFIMSEKGSMDRQKAEAMREEMKRQYVDAAGKIKTVHIKTPQGEADCYCEVGIYDIEID